MRRKRILFQGRELGERKVSHLRAHTNMSTLLHEAAGYDLFRKPSQLTSQLLWEIKIKFTVTIQGQVNP